MNKAESYCLLRKLLMNNLKSGKLVTIYPFEKRQSEKTEYKQKLSVQLNTKDLFIYLFINQSFVSATYSSDQWSNLK